MFINKQQVSKLAAFKSASWALWSDNFNKTGCLEEMMRPYLDKIGTSLEKMKRDGATRNGGFLSHKEIRELEKIHRERDKCRKALKKIFKDERYFFVKKENKNIRNYEKGKNRSNKRA